MSKRNEQTHKVVLLGDSGVGKTCILCRYNHGKFKSQSPTIGATFSTRRLKIDGESDYISLQLWDTAGQERFKSMLPMYYRGAASAVVCFDSTRKQTAENVKNWVKDLQHHADEDILVVINCTKTDLLRETPEWRSFIKNYIRDTSRNNRNNLDNIVSSADRTGSLSSFSSTLTGSNAPSSNITSISEASSQLSPLSECDSQSDTSFGLTGLYSDPRHPFFDMIQYAKSINAIYVETSSKENEGIDDLFYSVGKRLIDNNRRRRRQEFGYIQSPTGKSRFSDETDGFLNGDIISTTSSAYTIKTNRIEKQSSGGCCGFGNNKPTSDSSPRRDVNVMYVKTGAVDDRYR